MPVVAPASTPALELLRDGVNGLLPGYQPSGELFDPVFGEPTQYGTAYFAYSNAVLARHARGPGRTDLVRRARDGLEATLRHLLDPHDPSPAAADFTHGVASPGFRNLRDFMWPPVLRTFRILRGLDVPDLTSLADMVRAVQVPGAFSERPPVNWATVWILGEWLRIQEGLSSFDLDAIDGWLEPFFSDRPDLDHGFYRELREATGSDVSWGSAVDLERGFYREPGVPNSYDLFSRVHLLELLVEGYDGVHAPTMRRLVATGTRRSLGVQLSTGSLATAYRSSAHLWNLTTQCWYFVHAGRMLRTSEPVLAVQADAAALRAFHAAQACRRPTGDLSPVENVHPASWRVGHEVYTMDAHYVTLPLAYLGDAIEAGFTGEGEIAESDELRLHLEEEPVHRHLAHGRGWSVHVNMAPFEGYDALGIADLTAGVGRRLRFGGQVHWGRPDAAPDAHKLSQQSPFTLGLALRADDRSVHLVAGMKPIGARGTRATTDGFCAFTEVAAGRYEIEVSIRGESVRLREQLGDGARSLVVPYLRDRGDGYVTDVVVTGSRIRLRSGEEELAVVVDADVERILHLPFGYESRHGLVGLVRLDLAGTGPVEYVVERVA